MAFTFVDLQNEVKRRATRDQAGTQYDTAVKNIINTSLFRISREAPWRSMRRKSTFSTTVKYTTGSGGGTFTNGSKSVTITGATLLTDGVDIGRRISLQGSSKLFTIKTITGETTLTIDINYDGTTISGTGTYSILGQGEYNLPIQSGHRMFLWHEDYGYPYQMTYMTEMDFINTIGNSENEATPEIYRMWGEDYVISQPKQAGTLTISSSDSTDTNIAVNVFGTVSGYPDFETITTNASNGTTSVTGSKSFTTIERVIKASSSTGRITMTADSASTTVAVLPVGDTTAGIQYKKVQIYPLPTNTFPINVQYYKDPYRLVNDNDVHELGQEFDEAIIMLCVAKIKYENGQEEGDKWLSLYIDEIRNLKKTNVDKIDWFPSLRSSYRSRHSSLHPQLSYKQVGGLYGPKVRY